MALGVPVPVHDDGRRNSNEGTVWSVSVGSDGGGGGSDGGAAQQQQQQAHAQQQRQASNEGTVGSSDWSLHPSQHASVASAKTGETTTTNADTPGSKSIDTSGIDKLELPGRYEPESMRHLDVEATLATLGGGDDDDGTYSYVAGCGRPYQGTTSYEKRRKRRRMGITTLIFLGAAGVAAVALLATFGVIELEEVYGWVRGGEAGQDETNGGSSSGIIMTDGSKSLQNHHQFRSKHHVLVDRTADCVVVTALHTHEGWDACERACMSASCCHEPPGDKLSCVTSKTRPLCEEYTTLCGRLHTIAEPPGGKEAVAYVPPAPDNLSTICSEDSIATAAGLMQCEEECHFSRCCKYRADDKLRNCYVGNEDACAMYDRPCHVLSGFDYDPKYEEAMKKVQGALSSSERNEAIVSDLCSENSLQEHVGRESCKEVCKSHLCCFAGAGYGVENMNVCPPDLAGDCPVYTPCRVAYLSGIGNGAPNPYDPEGAFDRRSDIVEAVADACKEGGATCHEVCDAHMCCFVEDVDECPAKRGEACDLFRPCEILL